MIFNWELELSSLIKVVKIEAHWSWNSGSCDLKSLSLGQALTDYKSTNNFSLSLERNNNNKY